MAASQHITYDLTGRVAVVTGALGALGMAAAQAFAEAGARVVAVARAERPEYGQLRERLGEHAARLELAVANISEEASVAGLIEGVVRQHGRLDVLVNTVGGYEAGQSVTALEEATWERMLDLNLRTAFLLAKHAAAPMIAQRWGRILHTASRAAYSGRRNAAAYAVSKAGVLTLMEAQAEELRDQNITVNAVVPGIIDTTANRAAMPKADASRWPAPAEIARVMLFLASDDAAIISGAAIPVYGQS